MVIYQAKNKVNGKAYIGQTARNFKERKYHHLNDTFNGSNLPFHRAIRKYGSGNFDWEILEECYSIEELNESEEYWIRELNVLVPDGYNLMSGGNNSTHHKKTLDKMSKIKQGENHPMYGKIGVKHPRYGKFHTEETKIKMSKARQGENNNFYGKKHTEESLKKMYGIKRTEESKTTMRENHADFSGEKNPQAKLTEEDVLDIRKRYKDGMSYKEIAKIKNSTYQNVYKIVNYKSWKHVV